MVANITKQTLGTLFVHVVPSDVVCKGGTLAHSEHPCLGAGVNCGGGHITTCKYVWWAISRL